VPTISAASGVWTLGEQYLARVADIWPVSVAVPAVVENSVMWLDAADLSTITESGGSVSQWDNKGSLGNFTQGSGALQPTTGASTLNGRNVLDFSSDLLTAVNTNEWKFLHDGTKYVVHVVGKVTNVANQQRFIDNIDTAITNGIGIENRATGQQGHIIAAAGTGQTVNITGNNQFVNNEYLVFGIVADPSASPAANRSEVYKNAGAAIKDNANTTAANTSNPVDALRIGQASSAASPLVGSIAEIVIVSGADATETNRVIIRDYLNAKWGVY
jgi:hypothetical protein